MISIGIIGLGEMGFAHVGGFNMLENCSVDAICDIDNEKTGRASAVLSGKKFLMTIGISSPQKTSTRWLLPYIMISIEMWPD